MHKLPEKEQLARAVDNYKRGLILAEKTRFASRVKEAWVERYRVAMELEQAKRTRHAQAEKGYERDIDSDRKA